MDSKENMKNQRDLFEWTAKMKAKIVRLCGITKGFLGMEFKERQ